MAKKFIRKNFYKVFFVKITGRPVDIYKDCFAIFWTQIKTMEPNIISGFNLYNWVIHKGLARSYFCLKSTKWSPKNFSVA